jgi:predicted RNA-binding protein associated with RNAse of E/G family
MPEGLLPEDIMAMMEADELQDALEVEAVMTVGDYARARSIRPQRIHSWLRNKKLERKKCQCGRLVIDVKEANKLLDGDEDDLPS